MLVRPACNLVLARHAFAHHCPVGVEGHADHAPLLRLVLGSVGGHRLGVRVEDVVAGDVRLGETISLVADRPARRALINSLCLYRKNAA